MRTRLQCPSMLLFAITFGWTAIGADRPTAPNVLIILADDLGYSDLGCYGGEIDTPNLDQLAANGLRFTQFYNTARCWPTRAGIMTGYYAQQVRRDALPKVPDSGVKGRRPEWARLLPEYLKTTGYRTYHSGKWHIDGNPLDHGFDHSYVLDDQDRFFTPRLHLLDGKPLPAVDAASKYYATTAIASHSIECLKSHARDFTDKPFFEYLCFTCPHFPLQAPSEDIAKYEDLYRVGWDSIRDRRFARVREMGLVNCELAPREELTSPPWNLSEDELQKRIGLGEIGRAIAWNDLTDQQRDFQVRKMAIHAAMVDRMDREIGRVIEQLKQMRAFDDTLILFLSDNGASAEQIIRGDGHDPTAPAGSARSYLGLGPGWSTVSNTPFRLHKSWVHEGGISTPLIVHWPNGISDKGKVRHAMGHIVDLVPTIIEITKSERLKNWNGQTVPSPPGISLAPVFADDISLPRDYLWWYHIGNRAVRSGDWKLVALGKFDEWELYNLKYDRSETNNLAKMHPEKVRELERLWNRKLEEFQEIASRDLQKSN